MALVRPVLKQAPITSDAFYDCVEDVLAKNVEKLEKSEVVSNKKEKIDFLPEIKKDFEEKCDSMKKIVVPSSKPVPPPLERRLSNVERFLKESSPEPEPLPKKENSRVLLGIVYTGCAFVALQLNILIAILLSTSIPFGLMFLVVCLCVIVALICQICFTVRKTKDTKHISRKRRRDASVTEEKCVETAKNKIILECERRGKPVAPVKPFILVRIPSTKELLNGIGLKASATMNIASDLLKKKV